MKKSILLGILFVIVQQLHAQSDKYHYGIQIGPTISTYALSNISSGTTRSATDALGLSVTGSAGISLSKHFGIQSGLSFQLLGAKLTYSEFGKTSVLQRTFWLQVPVHFVAKLPLRDSSYFFINAGPYGALGLMGTNNFESSYTGERTNFTFGSTGTQKRFDYGLSLGLGYELKRGYRLSANYLWGAANLATTNRYEQRNRAWLIGLGYFF